jgi:hypothetical protein
MDNENIERMRQLLIDMHKNEGPTIIFDTKLAEKKGYCTDEILSALDIIERTPDNDELMKAALLGYYKDKDDLLPRIFYIREVGLLFFYFYATDQFYYGFREQVPQCIDEVIATLKCNI